MKKKLIVFILLIVAILFSIGCSITYARYKESIENQQANLQVAKFVFEDRYTNEIDLTLNTIKPGDELTTQFQVINTKTANSQNIRSEVVVEYNIVIESLYSLPLELRLYKGTSTTPTITCTKTSSTLTGGVYKCQTPNDEIGISSDTTVSYSLKIKFPQDNNGTPWSTTYSGQNDYVKLYLNASQKQ